MCSYKPKTILKDCFIWGSGNSVGVCSNKWNFYAFLNNINGRLPLNFVTRLTNTPTSATGPVSVLNYQKAYLKIETGNMLTEGSYAYLERTNLRHITKTNFTVVDAIMEIIEIWVNSKF